MGEQRQFFRFRLPWLSATAAPRPVAEPLPRPAAQTQAPSQPSVTIPIQRPPFRPAGIAPVQTTPTQAQAPAPPQKTEPQPVPSRGTIQTQPQSPAPTPARAASMTPSSTRIALQPESMVQAVLKQQSPSRLAPQPAGLTSSQLPSPSRRASQVQTLSPAKKSAMAIQVESQSPSSTQPLSSPSPEQTFKPFGVAVKPSEESTQLEEVAPITAAVKETPSAPVKAKEMEERKKVAEERRKATTKGSTHEEPTVTTKLLAAATEARTKTRELLGAAMEIGKRHQEKQEDIERKKTLTTSSTDEKQNKTVSSTYPKDRSRPSNSHEKHVDSKLEQVPLHKEIREDISKFVHKLVKGQPKLPTDEKSVSVITLAGENSGASFLCGSESTKKDGLAHIKIKPGESTDATTDGEGSSRGRKHMDSIIKENLAPKAYVNSNTQSINNSIALESSLGGRNPGVHLDIFHEVKAKPLEPRQVKFVKFFH